jgi:processive 1,2-diacylglycerol beta-glucosyltransferase
MARVLILHASVGSGHKRAGEALREAFTRRQPGQVQLADVLDYANPLFREAYARSYIQMTDKLPALWSYVYGQTDRDIFRYTSEMRALADSINAWGLRRLLRNYAPTIIVCTHFLPVEVLAARKARARLREPLYCVLTDYAAHLFWAYRNVDGYFVAADQTRAQLVERGVPPSLVRVTGIPVDPKVTVPKESLAVRAAHDLAADKPVVTLFGGGLDDEHVRIIVEGLLKTDLHGTLIVAAGRNRNLQTSLDDLVGTPSLALRVLGFVDYVDDLVVASDIVVTKAGGLIVSEVLARGRPMIIIDPIPGQEESNADYLAGVGAAISIRLPEHVPFAITQLLDDKPRFQQMCQTAARAARPRAALDIVEEILRDVGEIPNT